MSSPIWMHALVVPAGPVRVPPQRKVTLQQVMALCVEVEDRNNFKAVTPVTVNATAIEKCHYGKKSGHKEPECRRKEREIKLATQNAPVPQSSRSVTPRSSMKGFQGGSSSGGVTSPTGQNPAQQPFTGPSEPKIIGCYKCGGRRHIARNCATPDDLSLRKNSNGKRGVTF